MEDERDLLIFTDENGEDIQMEIVDYFTHNGQEYALLMEAEDMDDDSCGCGDDCDCEGGEQEVYVMRVVSNGDEEEFIPVEEDEMDELMEIIENLYEDAEEE